MSVEDDSEEAMVVNGIRQDCGVGVFDNALDYADALPPMNPYDPAEAYARGAEWGAGWMVAVIGMGQAIRAGRFCLVCERPWPKGLGPDVCRYCCDC